MEWTKYALHNDTTKCIDFSEVIRSTEWSIRRRLRIMGQSIVLRLFVDTIGVCRQEIRRRAFCGSAHLELRPYRILAGVFIGGINNKGKADKNNVRK